MSELEAVVCSSASLSELHKEEQNPVLSQPPQCPALSRSGCCLMLPYVVLEEGCSASLDLAVVLYINSHWFTKLCLFVLFGLLNIGFKISW